MHPDSPNVSNGDMPLDAIDQARVTLTRAAVEATERRDAIKAQLDQAQEAVHRYERALKGLEPPQPKAPPKPRAVTERAIVKAKRASASDPSVTQAASGYPVVSEDKQQQVLDALRAVGRPAVPSEIVAAGQGTVSKSAVQNGLAHLRARGLVRWSGKGTNNGHLYALYDWAPTQDELTESDA